MGKKEGLDFSFTVVAPRSVKSEYFFYLMLCKVYQIKSV